MRAKAGDDSVGGQVKIPPRAAPGLSFLHSSLRPEPAGIRNEPSHHFGFKVMLEDLARWPRRPVCLAPNFPRGFRARARPGIAPGSRTHAGALRNVPRSG